MNVMKECRSAFWTVAVFSFIINILMLATPLYMLQVMDRVLRSGRIETLVLLTLMACGAILVMSVLDTLRSSIAMRTGAWINEQLGPVFLESSVRANLRGDYSGADTLRDLGEIQSFIATQGMAAFFDSPWVPIFVVFIWCLHPYLGMVALISALALFALSLANEWATRAPTRAAHAAQTEAMHLADVTIRNAEVVRAMGLMPAMLARWRAVNADVTAAYQMAGETAGHVLSVTKFVRYSVQIAVLGVGAWLVVDNEITSGAMIAGAILLGRALAPVEMAIGGWKSFVSARLAHDRLREHLETYPPEPQYTTLPQPEGRLSVEDLTYAVPGNGPVILSGITFEVEPGEALAIIGPSGAGKSTLCRLLVGLSEPAAGAVRLDGSELRHWKPDQLGRYIGYLPQDVELFPGTVHENIARMGPADDEAVIAAAMRAYAHPLIQRLPDGYATHIGDGGIRLSGGQRQRIGLARAVFGDPRLIVLDEPNANLDQAGEQALADALKALKQRGCALIIVGHRPSTLAQADKILVLKEGGTAVMFGDRDEVLEALSEASANKGGSDTVPLWRSNGQGNALTQSSERSLEAGAS
jgi:ATP-binding cassette subfamily C protein/ATP-binding cassette subfamily C exporter for protease/lipase/ATP-binding cassette subfamily C protein EexD